VTNTVDAIGTDLTPRQQRSSLASQERHDDCGDGDGGDKREQFISVVVRLSVTVRRAVRRDEIEITAAATLAEVVNYGHQRGRDLAAREGVAQPTMSKVGAGLEQHGLVERHPDPNDGRILSVSDSGRMGPGRRPAGASSGIDVGGLGCLSVTEQAELPAALERMSRGPWNFGGGRWLVQATLAA
jgi:MarR family